MTLYDLYFNQELVNDDTILRIQITDKPDWLRGHWYDDGVSIGIYNNKDRIVDSFTWVSRIGGAELIIKLRDEHTLPY